jgi:hypothetical protein
MATTKKRKEQKLYRGAFNYMRNDNIYTEETFDVYREKKEMGLIFVAQTISRVSTGELLNISVEYTINKDFLPTKVSVSKTLGNEHVDETYSFNHRNNIVTYTFKTKEEEEVCEISVGPKFHIAAPVVCTSMTFLKTKKVDATSKTYFSSLVSPNKWTFEGPPVSKNIVIQRLTVTAENLSLDGSNVSAMEYKLSEQTDEENEMEADTSAFIRVFVSPHVTIPYLIQSEEGTKMQVKYLNDLSEAEI